MDHCCDPSRQWNIIQHQKEMSYQAMKRHGAILLGKRSQFEKVTHCIIPIICHSGKSKSTEMKKRSLILRGSEGERDEQADHRGFLGQ